MFKILPKKLSDKGFKFVKIHNKTKRPFEFQWQSKANYCYDDKELINWIGLGNNYGVVGGYKGLLIIDFDDKDFENEHVPYLPETFTVQTGSGGTHMYYICDDPASFKILDANKNTLADIQGRGKQVVGPGSTHPNGEKYFVINDIQIAKITTKAMRVIFSKYLPKQKKEINSWDNDKVIDQIKFKVSISDVFSQYGADLTRNPTMCTLGHTSKSKSCLYINAIDNLFYCHHCGAGGDVFNAIMAHEHCDFPTAKKKLMEMAGIAPQESLQNQISSLPNEVLQIKNYYRNVITFHTIQPFFYDKAGLFWMWNKETKCYEVVDDVDLMNMIDKKLKFMGMTASRHHTASYMLAFKRVGRLKIPVDAPKEWIQFKDKVYNLKTNDIIDATPTYFVCNPIPWELGESSDTPRMDKLFKEWVGDDFVKTLYQILAYSCLPDYPIHRIFCLVGGGRNGKSQYQKLVRKFIGTNNVCSADLDRLASPSQRFEKSKLYKKLVCLLGETNFGTLANTSTLKQLSGGDSIDIEFKNKNPFTSMNYAKIIINSNSLPSSLDQSDGFYRRWLIMEWPNEFPEGKDILDTIPEKEYNNLARKIIDVLPELLNKGAFHNEGTIEQRKKKYIFNSNPLSYFLGTFCYVDVNGYVSYDVLFSAYVQYLIKTKKRVVSRKEFNQVLQEEGFVARRTMKTIDGEYVKGAFVDNIQLVGSWQEKLSTLSTLSTKSELGSIIIETSSKNRDKVYKVDKVKKGELNAEEMQILQAKMVEEVR